MVRTALRHLNDQLGLAPVVMRAIAIDTAAHTFARLRYALPDAHPGRFQIALQQDVAYRAPRPKDDVRANLVDVYMPTRAPKPLPVVMYVHGGAFCILSKDTHRVMAMAIARRGYLVFNVNYRLGPKHRFPAPLEDVSLALAWVKENAARFGGDPDRIAIAGESAGGNLVTALAVASSYRRPEPFAKKLFDADVKLRGVVATYGFLDIGYTNHYLSNPKIPSWAKALLLDAAKAYLGPRPVEAARHHPLASPLGILESGTAPDRPLPPFFVSVGTKDPLLRCSKRLKAALDAKGTPCILHLSPGEIHGYDALVWRPGAREKWRAAHDFLGEHMAQEIADDVDEALSAQ